MSGANPFRALRLVALGLSATLLAVTNACLLPPVCCLLEGDDVARATASCCAPEAPSAATRFVLTESDSGVKPCCAVRIINTIPVTPPPRLGETDALPKEVMAAHEPPADHACRARVASNSRIPVVPAVPISPHVAHTVFRC